MDRISMLKERMDPAQLDKLTALNNPAMMDFVAEYVEHLNPSKIFVCNDSPEDVAYLRSETVNRGEEKALDLEGHTIHFDSFFDQARDKANTRILVPEGFETSETINTIDKAEGLEEVRGILKNIMEGHELLILFFCLGPQNSPFSIPCIQLTDSFYVAHSETILYRQGYEQFKKTEKPEDFFRFVHSQGELENGVSKNVDKRRVYVDVVDRIVYSSNTQYAGNTVGLKKLALRPAIYKATNEDWLAEHMFVMGVNGPDERKTYFAGAFPSACGKTSTSMMPGETIIGDDIAYFRNIDDECRAVNVEQGIFGIIGDVNKNDDPVLYDSLTKPGEVIFSNILRTPDNKPYWKGRSPEVPEKGENFSGEWYKGKKDDQGNEIPPAHKNARFTLRIDALENQDENMNLPEGVPVGGIIYGGRDSDTSVPVEQSFSWEHGIITKGAMLESETTAATLGKEGVRVFNPMSNLDFVPIALGKYITKNLEFGEKLEKIPLIFSVNYFQKDDDGSFLTGMNDKRVWIKWMELRVHGDAEAIETPTGLIPLYDDLKKLFAQVLDKEYTQEDYVRQFTVRIPENLARIDRIEEIYKTKVSDTPDVVLRLFNEQRDRLKKAAAEHGDCISPLTLAGS